MKQNPRENRFKSFPHRIWAGFLPDIDLTLLRDPRTICGPACDSSLAGASLVCLTCKMWSELDNTEDTKLLIVQHLNSSPPTLLKLCLAKQTGMHCVYLASVLLCSSPESRPSSDLVPVPTLVVIVTNLLPTNHVLVLPPAKRNSPTGDLKAPRKRWTMN